MTAKPLLISRDHNEHLNANVSNHGRIGASKNTRLMLIGSPGHREVASCRYKCLNTSNAGSHEPGSYWSTRNLHRCSKCLPRKRRPALLHCYSPHGVEPEFFRRLLSCSLSWLWGQIAMHARHSTPRDCLPNSPILDSWKIRSDLDPIVLSHSTITLQI